MGLCDTHDSINRATEPQRKLICSALGRSAAWGIQDLSGKKTRYGTTHSAEDWINMSLQHTEFMEFFLVCLRYGKPENSLFRIDIEARRGLSGSITHA